MALGQALVVTRALGHLHGALRVDAGGTAHGYLLLDGFAVAALPVGPEDAGHAGGGEDEGVGLGHVASELVAVAVGIVVVNEGDGVAVVVVVVYHARGPPGGLVFNPRHLAVVALGEAVVEGGVLHGEVEGHAAAARAFNPGGHLVVGAVPVFADREVGRGGLVVEAHVFSPETLDEVVAPAVVAEVAAEPGEVGLAVVLDVGGGVVEVARAAPVFAGVGSAGGLAVPFAGGGVGVHLVGAADVFGGELEVAVGAEVVGGEVAPVAVARAVVDDDVGEDADVVGVEGGDEGAEVVGGAPAGGLVVPLAGVVADVGAAHRAAALGTGRRGQPDEGEVAGYLGRCGGEGLPAGFFLGVPVEALEHHVFALGGGLRAERSREDGEEGEKGENAFHGRGMCLAEKRR